MLMIKSCLKKCYNIWIQVVLSLHLYKKEEMPTFSEETLLEKWHYKNPQCVSELYKMVDEDKNIFFSIIIPLYNSEIYIKNLIGQLVNQKTCYQYEVILVNDGSKDSTDQIVSKYLKKFPKILRYYKQENAGISAARNTGIDHARGRYIGFIDHDDEITENYVQKVIEAADLEKADRVIVTHDYKRNGKIQGKPKNGGFVWGGCYKRKVFDKVRFPVGYWYEDMIGGFLLTPACENIIQIEEILYYKRITSTNASSIIWSDKNNKSLEQLYLMYSLILDYQKLGFEKNLYLLTRILNESSALMVRRTKGLDINTKKQVFLACNKIINQYDVKLHSFSKKQQDFYNAIIELDFKKWLLLGSMYT